MKRFRWLPLFLALLLPLCAAGEAAPRPLDEESYLAALPEGAEQIVLTAGGDTVLGSEESKRASAYSFDSFVRARGYAWPLSALSELFHSDDVTFVNLECVLKNSRGDKTPYRAYNFRGPTDFVNILSLGGVEIVNLANNHYIDYGDTGKKSTRAALAGAGISYGGYGFNTVIEAGGRKIGFGGIRETIYKQRAKKIDDDIRELKAAGAEVIVYACHFGTEYERTHNDLQTRMAYRAIDAGADIVIGHHPHVVQGVEMYKNRPICYSLGNLVFGGNLLLTETDGLLARVTLDFSGGACLGARVTLLPILTTGSAPANDFRPVLASGEDAARVFQKIQDDTAFPVSGATMCFLFD